MKKILILLGGVALVAAVFGLNQVRTGESDTPLLRVAPEDALPVSVTEPEQQTIVRRVQAPGEIEAVLEVEIRSEMPAKIEEMPVEEGDTVEAGQLLCRLNDDEFRAMVESGEAGVAQLKASIRDAEADLAKCKRDCSRQERLARLDAASDLELADHRTSLLKAEANIEMRRQQLAEAEAMLRRARDNLKKTVIVSPIDGIVSQVFAEPGEVVITGTMNNPGTVVMVITDLSRMQVRARVDETDVPLVQPDQATDIFLPSDTQRAIPGRVLRVATSGTKQVGRDVVTFETLILVESDDSAVKPGMTSNVEIQVARKENALTVPVEAVVHRKRKDLPEKLVEEFEQQLADQEQTARRSKAQYLKVIFCKNGDEAHPHLVQTGIADETHVELLDGVAAGEVVITGPYRTLDQLKDGAKVKLEEKKKEKGAEQTDQAEADAESKLATDKDQAAESDAGGNEVAEAQ
ncbi:MAG TPA: efflux RND transporter periplasmic adaptor subunit [Phycisphaerae bacterium]|nr:efflux RND transporter periplasmic adaptor subunit [Phycisphaerae bacterium]